MNDLHDVGRWDVEKRDVRPARQDGTCFYCSEPVGGTHKKTCVIPSKVVKVKFHIELDVLTPLYDEDNSGVLFRYNEGSWCANNLIHMIETEADRLEGDGLCLCGRVSATLVE